jgi:hypothetical protein
LIEPVAVARRALRDTDDNPQRAYRPHLSSDPLYDSDEAAYVLPTAPFTQSLEYNTNNLEEEGYSRSETQTVRNETDPDPAYGIGSEGDDADPDPNLCADTNHNPRVSEGETDGGGYTVGDSEELSAVETDIKVRDGEEREGARNILSLALPERACEWGTSVAPGDNPLAWRCEVDPSLSYDTSNLAQGGDERRKREELMDISSTLESRPAFLRNAPTPPEALTP